MGANNGNENHATSIQDQLMGQFNQAIKEAKPPMHMVEGFRRFVFDQIMPGGFMLACLSNNFREAALRADHPNTISIRTIALFMDEALPPESWGSTKKVNKWLKSNSLDEALGK